MANIDHPNGFTPVKSLTGAPWNSMIRKIGVVDGADIFIGDALQLDTGLAEPLAVEGEVLGVAVGFGRQTFSGRMSGENAGPAFDPTNLNAVNYYDYSASTHTEWVCYYVPAEGMIFEAQVDDTAEIGLVGEAYDIVATAGSTVTGVSAHEINGNAKTNDGDVIVVEIPHLVDNDPVLAFGRYWVSFVNVGYGGV